MHSHLLYQFLKKGGIFQSICWSQLGQGLRIISKQWLLAHSEPTLYALSSSQGVKGDKAEVRGAKILLCWTLVNVDHNPVALLVRVIRRRDRESSIKAFSVTAGCSLLSLSNSPSLDKFSLYTQQQDWAAPVCFLNQGSNFLCSEDFWNSISSDCPLLHHPRMF